MGPREEPERGGREAGQGGERRGRGEPLTPWCLRSFPVVQVRVVQS